MPHSIVTATNYYVRDPASTTFTNLTLPANVSIPSTPGRPSFLPFKGRTYSVGWAARGLLLTEHSTLFRMGIAAPSVAPTLVSDTGTITGSAIAYYTFAHYIGSQLIAESNPSAPSATLALVAQGRGYTGLPVFSLDTRVTHVHIYVSMDGAVPRLAAVRELGTVNAKENVATAVLANQTALPVDDALAVDTLARGVPPADALFGAIFHSRAWYVRPGDPNVYRSKLNEPEAVNTATEYETLTGGEYPTGLGVTENELLVFHARGAYAISGFGSGDWNLRRLANAVGCISHHSIVNIGRSVFFASQEGVHAYLDGGFRNLMARSFRTDWTAAYAANQSAYENSQAIDDQRGNYKLLVPLSVAPKTLMYLGYYRAMTEEDALEPKWYKRILTRKTFALGVLGGAGGKKFTETWGSDDGFLRQPDATNSDDDGDTYAKALTLIGKAEMPKDQAGDAAHGHTWPAADIFVKNPNTALTVNFYAGDDTATDGTPLSKTIAAGLKTGTTDKTSHRIVTPRLAGKTCAVGVTATSPVGFEWRGFALENEPSGAQAP